MRYASADEYLSSNIREKLEAAKNAAESDNRLLPNVEALEKAMTGRLYPHLYETQKVANQRLGTLMAQLVKRDPPPDKATDNLAWAAHMNALKHSAEEVILNELIYE